MAVAVDCGKANLMNSSIRLGALLLAIASLAACAAG
jgi:hypothetical protein